jgi:hypothetical protein
MVSGAVAVLKAIRAADAKEVGVGNPAEETYRYPNQTRANFTDSSHNVNI